MPNKKAFVCFCVDGKSDDVALRSQFSELFDKVGGDDIHVDFRYAKFRVKDGEDNHGDITTLNEVYPNNIEKNIYKLYFKKQEISSDIGWEDLTCIIHIIDIDGAYVDDIREFTREESQLSKSLKNKNTLYFDDHIAVCPDKEGKITPIEGMKLRNHHKRQNIEHLVNLDRLTIGKKSVQYYLYYFCSNLDHYLYGAANMGKGKCHEAEDFAAEYQDAEAFSDFFNNSPYSTTEDYISSWESLRKGNNSLARGTNLNLLIDKIRNSTLDDWL